MPVEIKMTIEEKEGPNGNFCVGMQAKAEGMNSTEMEREVANRVIEAAAQVGEAMAKENLGGHSMRRRGNLG